RACVVEAEHAGAALDRVRVAEQRIEGLRGRTTALESEERVDHVVEPFVRLVAEQLEKLRFSLVHASSCASVRKSRGTSTTPTRSPSSSAAPCRNFDSASSAGAASAPTSTTSSIAKPARRPSCSTTSKRR